MTSDDKGAESMKIKMHVDAINLNKSGAELELSSNHQDHFGNSKPHGTMTVRIPAATRVSGVDVGDAISVTIQPIDQDGNPFGAIATDL